MTLIVDFLLSEHERRPLSALRARYFSKTRLKTAHITVFHNLPDLHEAAIRMSLTAVADNQQGSIAVAACGLYSLGRGWALRLNSPELKSIQLSLQSQFKPWLQPQDLQPYRPHITLANKLERQQQPAIRQALAAEPLPTTLQVLGLGLHRYMDGEWDLLDTFGFED